MSSLNEAILWQINHQITPPNQNHHRDYRRLSINSSVHINAEYSVNNVGGQSISSLWHHEITRIKYPAVSSLGIAQRNQPHDADVPMS